MTSISGVDKRQAVLNKVNAKLIECDCAGISLEDIQHCGTGFIIDGMPWRQWLEAMTMD